MDLSKSQVESQPLSAEPSAPDRKPPSAFWMKFCNGCGGTDLHHPLRKKHWSRGAICKGVIIEVQYDLSRAAVAEDHCWHCGVVLTPSPKPHCEDCPAECDVEDCDEMGCALLSQKKVKKGE